MRFHARLSRNSLDMLNLRVKVRAGGCPHCHCTSALVGHGFLKGFAACGSELETRAMRFYCSNRHAKLGCGRTFPVYWSSVIPHASLRAEQLLKLLEATTVASSPHAAWQDSRLPISHRGACRWLAKWRRATAEIRTRLGLLVGPPGRIDDARADPWSLHHLAVAFPGAGCAIAAFQKTFQRMIVGPLAAAAA